MGVEFAGVEEAEEAKKKRDAARRASEMAAKTALAKMSNSIDDQRKSRPKLSCDACMMVGKRSGVRTTIVGKRYDGKAFFLLGVGNPLRSVLIDIIENEWWDRVVLLVVLANCFNLIPSIYD